jgi:putative hydrolase of the HAD superfamily
VLKENNLDPEETLFIDDSPQHIRGALACGIQARHLDVQSGQKLEGWLDSLLSELGSQ